MSCPSCQTANPESARFCQQCGARLALEGRECRQCGTELLPEARFCHRCGESAAAGPASGRSLRDYTPAHLAQKILRQRSALEGERKQVTALRLWKGMGAEGHARRLEKELARSPSPSS